MLTSSVLRCAGVAICATAQLILAGQPASAAQLINNDQRSYEIRIVADNERQSQQVAPGNTVDNLCPQGCILTLVGVEDGAYVLEGKEDVSIENGMLYYASPYVRREKEKP